VANARQSSGRYIKRRLDGSMEYGSICGEKLTVSRDLYTFSQDKVMSYELGTEEPPSAISGKNLFTASVDDILSRMGKVRARHLCFS
jgi:hypothetical protein